MSSNVELSLPQIAWHAKEPIQSVDTNPSSGIIATAGNDNDVRLWKLQGDGTIVFIQSLGRDGSSAHAKVHAQRSRPLRNARELALR